MKQILESYELQSNIIRTEFAEIIEKYGDISIVESLKEQIEAFEIRFTSRANIVQKAKSATDAGGATGWVGAGISLGYEF